MDNTIANYDSSDLSLLVYRIIMIICFSLLIFFVFIRFYITFEESESPNTGIIRFLLICIFATSISNFYPGCIFFSLFRYLHYPQILYRIVSFIPCATFTAAVSRISFLLIDIGLNIESDVHAFNKQKTILFIKLGFTIYVSLNFLSRLLVACYGNQSWMIASSWSYTLSVLSFIFSIVSISILSACSRWLYIKIKRVLMNSVGQKVNKNLQIFTFVFIFAISCYFVSLIIGKISVHSNDQIK